MNLLIWEAAENLEVIMHRRKDLGLVYTGKKDDRSRVGIESKCDQVKIQTQHYKAKAEALLSFLKTRLKGLVMFFFLIGYFCSICFRLCLTFARQSVSN